MTQKVLIFYVSYRIDQTGIRLADYLVRSVTALDADAELIDARQLGLPILDRMYKEYDAGEAPSALATQAYKMIITDAFVFVTGEYNCVAQPRLKNLIVQFLEEWFWRPAAIASYSSGRFSGVCAATAWHSSCRNWIFRDLQHLRRWRDRASSR